MYFNYSVFFRSLQDFAEILSSNFTGIFSAGSLSCTKAAEAENFC